jgi:regulator of cell morphogenesis and NO signaling
MISSESRLRAIALAQPATIRVFERFHLDYCCGGNRPLAEACAEKGIAAETVLAALAEATANVEPCVQDFARTTLAQLIRHIVQTHHAYVRGELPRLLPMAESSVAKHSPIYPEIDMVDRQLRQLADELIFHLNKEERILFPYIEALEQSHLNDGPVPHACFASMESPVQAMLNEHDAAGALLREMRSATRDFAPPPGACPTLVGLYHGLDAFERDLHRHVHLENNLLFPRAIAMEKEVLVAQ